MARNAVTAKPPPSRRKASGLDAASSHSEYALEEQVGFLLRKAQQRATSIFLHHFGRQQLTPTQWAALAKLHEQGGLSQNRLGRLVAMDQATIQGVIRRLTDRKLIAHLPDPQDRRRKNLTLTPVGEALVTEMLSEAFAVSQETLRVLDGEERRVFLKLLKGLG